MKKLFLTAALAAVTIVAVDSCVFKIDNFDSPKETVKGSFVDEEGQPVISFGTSIRLLELSYKVKHPEAVLSYGPYLGVQNDGTYCNTKMFKGDYEMYPYGAFMPYILKTSDNDTIYNKCPVVHIEKVTTVDFVVKPFLYLEIDEGSMSSSNGKLSFDVVVRRGVSKEEFKNVISQAGNYSDDFLNVKDMQIVVSYSPYVSNGNSMDIYSNHVEFAGDEFETSSKYGFDKPIHVSTKGNIKANRKVFVRVSARINYDVEGEKRYNYSQLVSWDF